MQLAAKTARALASGYFTATGGPESVCVRVCEREKEREKERERKRERERERERCVSGYYFRCTTLSLGKVHYQLMGIFIGNVSRHGEN